MGQTQTVAEHCIDDVKIETLKHTRIFQEMKNLSYNDFKKCLEELNDLSRKCLDADGKQMIFFIKKDTDTSMLWKATVRIACVKVHPITREIDNYKFLTLRQFLHVFKNFQTNIQSLISAEEDTDVPAVVLPQLLPSMLVSSSPPADDEVDMLHECCICMDRKMDVILPCTHSFCMPCIEQWNENNKSCPVCLDELKSTKESWVMAEKPGVQEVNATICEDFKHLGKKEDASSPDD